MTTIPAADRHFWGRQSAEESGRPKYVAVETRTMPRAARSSVKRSIDVVGALGGLFFLAPLFALIAILIRITSSGPALFCQERIGLHGRPFLCYKFRTMVADAESRLVALEAQNEVSCGVLFKIKNDPRVTKLGRFLRKTSLDELPQLWNVLLGEMSLIGPRPLQLRDSGRLAALEAEGYSRRLSVLPGLSGPWQVSGRSDLDGFQMLDLDLDYVENWSIARDAELLFRTIGVVMACRGSA